MIGGPPVEWSVEESQDWAEKLRANIPNYKRRKKWKRKMWINKNCFNYKGGKKPKDCPKPGDTDYLDKNEMYDEEARREDLERRHIEDMERAGYEREIG